MLTCNMMINNDDTGSGLASKNHYNYGFFSAAVKVPAGFSSGVVVAFYVSALTATKLVYQTNGELVAPVACGLISFWVTAIIQL